MVNSAAASAGATERLNHERATGAAAEFPNQYAVIGPPGTGKTTYVARQTEKAVEKYGDSGVMICSLTRTAAREAAGRVALPHDQVGTIHAMAYRALGSPAIAEAHVEEFNASGTTFRVHTSRDIDSMVDDKIGRDHYAEMALYRSTLRPRRIWDAAVSAFATEWESWKEASGYFDFCDLIDRAPDYAPSNPAVIFFDEAQDASPAEVKLLRRWGARCHQVITVGDPYQALYAWRGADPDVMFPPGLADDHLRVLHQSYRVPRAVHAVATRWVSKMPGYRPIKYNPTKDAGEVVYSQLSNRMPQQIVDAVGAESGTTMILATCGYMLSYIIKYLREAGLPFHNPWRAKQGAWNPLGSTRGTAMKSRLLAFDQPNRDQQFWSPAQVRKWAEVLVAKNVFRRSAKGLVAEIADSWNHEQLAVYMRDTLFTPTALARIVQLDTEWWYQNIMASKKEALKFPYRVFSLYGAAALQSQPQIIIGTIHSLKGAEADNVYLMPELSIEGYRQWRAGQTADIYRQFYVGMTRAKKKLVLLKPATPCAVDFGQ